MVAPSLPDAGISLISPLVPARATPATVPTMPSLGGHDAWDQLIDDLRRLRELEADWDGQGASALDAANVDSALAWVRRMRGWSGALPPSRVVPGVTGEVILEWQGESYYLAAEICKPGRVEWMLAVPDQPTQQWDTEGTNTWFVRGER